MSESEIEIVVDDPDAPAEDSPAVVHTQSVDVAVSRKTREEILVTLEILERFRREFEPTLLASLDKWSSLAEDAEVAEVLGSRVAGRGDLAHQARARPSLDCRACSGTSHSSCAK